MSGQPSMPDIKNENLRDPAQFKVKYEMEPFQFEVRKPDLSAGLYTAIAAAAGSLLVDVQNYGLNDSLAALPVQEAAKGVDLAKSQLNDMLNPSLRSAAYKAPAPESHQAVATALPSPQEQPPSPELRAGIYAGVTAMFAVSAVALASGFRHGKMFRKKHFKAKKSKVEALEAAYATGDSDTDPGKGTDPGSGTKV